MSNKKIPKFTNNELGNTNNNYSEFGKFMINTKLLYDDILLVKYKNSYAPVPTIKRTKISSLLTSILEDLIITFNINYDLLNGLEENEQLLFSNLLQKAGLAIQLKFNKQLIELTPQKLVDKYNILKGQIIAGNTNKEIIKQIEELLPKLIKANRLTEDKAEEIKYLINNL